MGTPIEKLTASELDGEPSLLQLRHAMTASPKYDFKMEPVSPAAEPLWRALDETGQGSFFTSWDWISSWLSTLSAHCHPELITAKAGNRTVGAAIGLRSARSRLGAKIPQLHFNASGIAEFDSIFVEHNDFAGEAGLLPDFVRWFAAQNGESVELVLPGVLEEIPLAGTDLVHSSRSGRGFANRELKTISREGVGSVLSRNARQQLSRSFRDFEAFGTLAVNEAASIEEALQYFGALKALHTESWSRRGKPHAFRYPYFEKFHRALIETAMPGGRIQLLKISAGGRVLGYLYNFRYRNRVHAYQSGFSDEDRALRPGYVCHALAMELNARRGMEEYDFLAGENQLKSSLSDTEYTLRWHSFAKPSPAIRLESLARAVRRLAGR